MSSQNSLAHTLTAEDFAKIRQLGNSRSYPKGAVIFLEGDDAACFKPLQVGSTEIFGPGIPGQHRDQYP